MGGGGPGAAPGDDREPFNPDAAYANSKPVPGQAPSFGGGGLSSLLSPLRRLSFWKMKDRARTIGESAGFSLLERAEVGASGRDVRFHLMGTASAASSCPGSCVARRQRRAARPVHSLPLVQGATSLWGYCTANPPLTSSPGYFRGLVDQKKVAGAI